MLDELDKIKSDAKREIVACRNAVEIESIRIKYLGRKGTLTNLIKKVATLQAEERPKFGQASNKAKKELLTAIQKKIAGFGIKEQPGQKTFLDLTLPGRIPSIGHKHPLTQIKEKAYQIFWGLGFEIVEGPEVETDYYNFAALNFPHDHPARDMHDSLYISDKILLRTHTSPVQIRTMEERCSTNQSIPIRIIAPGKVYRRDADITHTPMFHQIEGLLIDKEVSFAELKGTLTVFVHEMFGEGVNLRFRPSFFPFTEPSVEIDISCVMCGAAGCRVCSQSGWLEILGAGMVHPNVLKLCGYDPEDVSGFAFGMGVERIAMLKYGIDDIRLFFENDLRFLRQF